MENTPQGPDMEVSQAIEKEHKGFPELIDRWRDPPPSGEESQAGQRNSREYIRKEMPGKKADPVTVCFQGQG